MAFLIPLAISGVIGSVKGVAAISKAVNHNKTKKYAEEDGESIVNQQGLLEGWLSKRADKGALNSDSLRTFTWKPRYFRQTTDRLKLQYFVDKDPSKPPKGEISFEEIVRVEPGKDKDRLVISVWGEDYRRDFAIRAPNEQLRDKWVIELASRRCFELYVRPLHVHQLFMQFLQNPENQGKYFPVDDYANEKSDQVVKCYCLNETGFSWDTLGNQFQDEWWARFGGPKPANIDEDDMDTPQSADYGGDGGSYDEPSYGDYDGGSSSSYSYDTTSTSTSGGGGGADPRVAEWKRQCAQINEQNRKDKQDYDRAMNAYKQKLREWEASTKEKCFSCSGKGGRNCDSCKGSGSSGGKKCSSCNGKAFFNCLKCSSHRGLAHGPKGKFSKPAPPQAPKPRATPPCPV